jgi:hypothetical protein
VEYLEFNNTVRDMFDNVYAIHWKHSSLEHIQELVEYLGDSGNQVRYYTPDTNPVERVDFGYIERYFQGKETDFPSLEVEIDDFKFNCFLEYESTISLWFNDSSDSDINVDRFNFIKNIMRQLALKFDRTMYFVNEGESTYRYNLFKITSDAEESDYDLSEISKYAEEIA